jgi:hypothetical protein
MPVRGFAMVLACIVLLAACGGGGGGGAGNPSPGNSPPSIAAQTFNGIEDTVLTGQIAASDPGDTLAFASLVAPVSGALSMSATGGFTYTPNENFNGNDTFTARVTDSRGQTATATITLVLAAVNDAPSAVNDVLTVASADLLDVLANDADVDGDPLTVTLMGQAFAGTASLNAGNTVKVALPAGFKGFTKFNYRITDPAGLTADATALVFVGIEPFKVVNFRSSDDLDVRGFYVHDLFGERRATEANAVGLASFDEVRFASGGAALVYRGNNPASGWELRYLDLIDPAAQTRLINEPRNGASVGDVVISRDGRYVAYRASASGLGSWIELFDAEAPGFGTRLSLPFDVQPDAAQAQFSEAGTFVYYNGCAPSTFTSCTVHRASVASRVVERVAPAQLGASATLLTPVTRDDDRIVFQNVITHDNAPWEFPLLMSRPDQPDLATPLGAMSFGETSNFPLALFADGSRVFMTIASPIAPTRSVVASTTQPDDVIVLGGPSLSDGDIYLPRALRADSAAVLYRRCGGGSCQVYETRLDDPATSVPIGVPVAVTNSAYWQAQYSADGERMIYLREESNPSPFVRVVEVTRRDSPGETVHVTPNDGVAYLFELDASGRVVVASMHAGTGARMTLTNVDLPLVSLDLGEDSAGYQTYAVLPR